MSLCEEGGVCLCVRERLISLTHPHTHKHMAAAWNALWCLLYGKLVSDWSWDAPHLRLIVLLWHTNTHVCTHAHKQLNNIFPTLRYWVCAPLLLAVLQSLILQVQDLRSWCFLLSACYDLGLKLSEALAGLWLKLWQINIQTQNKATTVLV